MGYIECDLLFEADLWKGEDLTNLPLVVSMLLLSRCSLSTTELGIQETGNTGTFSVPYPACCRYTVQRTLVDPAIHRRRPIQTNKTLPSANTAKPTREMWEDCTLGPFLRAVISTCSSLLQASQFELLDGLGGTMRSSQHATAHPTTSVAAIHRERVGYLAGFISLRRRCRKEAMSSAWAPACGIYATWTTSSPQAGICKAEANLELRSATDVGPGPAAASAVLISRGHGLQRGTQASTASLFVR